MIMESCSENILSTFYKHISQNVPNTATLVLHGIPLQILAFPHLSVRYCQHCTCYITRVSETEIQPLFFVLVLLFTGTISRFFKPIKSNYKHDEVTECLSSL
uniref:Uncharacterized protein n=1 Tax=Anguilla anguilla TaxID=7936 RepID=A0A0E9S9J3_ANGAN